MNGRVLVAAVLILIQLTLPAPLQAQLVDSPDTGSLMRKAADGIVNFMAFRQKLLLESRSFTTLINVEGRLRRSSTFQLVQKGVAGLIPITSTIQSLQTARMSPVDPLLHRSFTGMADVCFASSLLLRNVCFGRNVDGYSPPSIRNG